MTPDQQLRKALRLIYGRERYELYTRETHMGEDYLVWRLVANPWPGHAVGKRWARLA